MKHWVATQMNAGDFCALCLESWAVTSVYAPFLYRSQWAIAIPSVIFFPAFNHMWCDQAKWVWSWKIWFLVFRHFLLGYCLGFNLVKTPQRLGNWFQRYKQLKDWTNNKKQKKLSALFGCILKTVFASSDSFCLMTSHMLKAIVLPVKYICSIGGHSWWNTRWRESWYYQVI